MSAETEGVGEGVIDVALTGLVEGEIEAVVDLRVVVEMVDGRRDDAILQGQNTSDGLDSASTAK